jgi:hypothetical protein
MIEIEELRTVRAPTTYSYYYTFYLVSRTPK